MKQRKKNTPLNKGSRNLLLLVGFFVVSIGLLSQLTDYTRHVKEMSYSEFMKAVNQGAVKSVHLMGNEAQGVLYDGTRFETQVANDPKMMEQLTAHTDVRVSHSSNYSFYWHLLLLMIPLGACLALWLFIRQSRGQNGGSALFSMGKSRAKMFSPTTPRVTFDAVAGATEAKQELSDIVDYLKNPEKYRKLGGKIPKGVLLVGEPGNGKTLLAKAVAGEANCPFYSITGSDFIEVFVGVGASRVRDLFATARRHPACIIFIDEIDAIGRHRGAGIGGGHDEREQTLNQLLTEMDGFDTADTGIVVLAATNMPEVLDKALLRPGRFDRRISVPYPDQAARQEILAIHAKTISISPDVDLATIAAQTSGFSGADLANLVNKAALIASKLNKPQVTTEDFTEAHASLMRAADDQNAVGAGMTRSSSKNKMFFPSQVNVKFSDVAGAAEAKAELQDFVNFLKNPKYYRRLGAKLPRGILMTGEPGNGKTLLARAVAGEANCPFFSVSGSEFVEMFVGVGAQRVRELFATARRHMPCIIFIDEIDAVGSERSYYAGSDERSQTLNQLLTEMDGFATQDSAIVVIGATNRPDVLDKALLRPGRLDKKIEVPYPDVASRKEILEVHTRKIQLDESVDLSKIARGTPGFSGASLAHLVNEATLHATRDPEQHKVTIADFDAARDSIILGKELRTRVITPKEREMTAYHEAGHALVPLLLPDQCDPLYKVTIVPRGHALGVTHSMPEGDLNSQTREQLLGMIMFSLGGRAAEELVYNTITTGIASDIQSATRYARGMVCTYGMTDELGPIAYDRQSQHFKYSEITGHEIDAKVRSLVNDSYAKTIELLRKNRDKLDKLAQALLEKETLFAAEIYELLEIKPRELFSLS